VTFAARLRRLEAHARAAAPAAPGTPPVLTADPDPADGPVMACVFARLRGQLAFAAYPPGLTADDRAAADGLCEAVRGLAADLGEPDPFPGPGPTAPAGSEIVACAP
jgi:hypothetical protein